MENIFLITMSPFLSKIPRPVAKPYVSWSQCTHYPKLDLPFINIDMIQYYIENKYFKQFFTVVFSSVEFCVFKY